MKGMILNKNKVSEQQPKEVDIKISNSCQIICIPNSILKDSIFLPKLFHYYSRLECCRCFLLFHMYLILNFLHNLHWEQHLWILKSMEILLCSHICISFFIFGLFFPQYYNGYYCVILTSNQYEIRMDNWCKWEEKLY